MNSLEIIDGLADECKAVVTEEKLQELYKNKVPFLFTPQTDYAQVMCPKCLLQKLTAGQKIITCVTALCFLDEYGYSERFTTFWSCKKCNTVYRLRFATGDDDHGNVPPYELTQKQTRNKEFSLI